MSALNVIKSDFNCQILLVYSKPSFKNYLIFKHVSVLLYLYVNTNGTNTDSNQLTTNTHLVQKSTVKKESIDTISYLKEITLFL